MLPSAIQADRIWPQNEEAGGCQTNNPGTIGAAKQFSGSRLLVDFWIVTLPDVT
jgi:hypothetical protein